MFGRNHTLHTVPPDDCMTITTVFKEKLISSINVEFKRAVSLIIKISQKLKEIDFLEEFSIRNLCNG
jgi:hypothetical protein